VKRAQELLTENTRMQKNSATVVRCLAMRICSEKCVFRRFCHTNVTVYLHKPR